MFINDVNKKEDIRKIAVQSLRKYGIKFREKHHRQISQMQSHYFVNFEDIETKCLLAKLIFVVLKSSKSKQRFVSKSTRFFKVRLQNLENETITLKNGQQLVIPKQLYEICCFIFNHVDTEGIFRKEGSRSRQQEIKLLLDRGCLLDDQHVIDVAVVLKYFLRELPEPLIPYSFHELFLRCSLIEKKIEAILLACLLLPSEHLNVLSFLMQFFSEVANRSHYNKMNSSNLATVVGPNIFPISEKIDAKNKLMVTKSCNIIKIMIENSHHIGEIPDYIIEQIGDSATSGQHVNIDMKMKRRSGSFSRIFHGLKKIVGNKIDEDIMYNTVTPDLLLTPTFHHSGKRQYEKTLPRSKKKEENINRKSETHKAINRRWSSITQASVKKKKRHSLIDTSSKEFYELRSDRSKNLNDHLQVSEKEYEEIKNRVCKIEKELSRELENVKPKSVSVNMNAGFDSTINNIQSAYEQTLVQTVPLSPTTDHLARRLSRELRIRTSSEQKIIRSPSARKIGNMKRQSRELEKPNNKIFKSSSFQFADINNSNNDGINCSSPDDFKFREEDMTLVNGQNQYYGVPELTNYSYKLNSHLSVNPLDQHKINCFKTDNYINSKILSNGMSPFKFNGGSTNLFENKDTVCKNKSASINDLLGNIIFNNDHLEADSVNSCVRISKLKDKSVKPNNASSIKRNINLKQKCKSEKASHTKRLSMNSKENLMALADHAANGKYNNLPYIKKSLIVKSPKRFCGTPTSIKNTPLKVLSASQCLNTNISF